MAVHPRMPKFSGSSPAAQQARSCAMIAGGALGALLLLVLLLRSQPELGKLGQPLEGFGAELVSVAVVFRHGARTPLADQYWPEREWSVCPNSYEVCSPSL